ncbi:DUF4352 domain-containing protein [Listeria sp. FSL L7-1582]|uniref:DUF4352 domain-containing protein n=1 Tax=Listeria rustica TaxID=2713503 RepID=A0A7W1T773_9LIST|nr:MULTISPECIES: DUF4352 domain-containing protein [Listeria]MBA3926756.1 DUF4352 domain-containing protein [Listeria rustica]MBC6309721.1 DUF4352 domain-containing protein [Listeria portnoyi]
MKLGFAPKAYVYEKQDANNFILNIDTVETIPTNNNQTKVLITMEIKNNAGNTQDIGSIDFCLAANKEVYDIDTDSNAFGQPVKAGETIMGDVTFVIPSKIKKANLAYKPSETCLAEWHISIKK